MDLARRSQQPHELRHVQAWLAEICVQQGNWAEANSLIAEAQAVVEQLEDDEPRAVLCRVRGLMSRYRDQREEAAGWYRQALAMIRAKGPQHLAWYLGPLARMELSLGNELDARGLMDELAGVLTRIPEGTLPTAPALTDAVEWALQAGELRRTQPYAERLQAFAGRMFLSAVDLTLARHEAARGNPALALTHLDRAEQDARRSGLRTQLLRILLERASAAGPQDHNTRSAALEEALAICEALQLDVRARAIRAELSKRRSMRTPAGLSSREMEVLRLVAAGHSNREIAEALVLSEKTIEHHLTNILNKTGTSNRAAATAFAVRHGLAE
jgi:DNA-binding NarL/FixJ family response regulator